MCAAFSYYYFYEDPNLHIMKSFHPLFIFLLLVTQSALAQKNPAAKRLSDQAVADSVSGKLVEAADGFVLAAKEEMKLPQGDAVFAGSSYQRAGAIYQGSKYYSTAHAVYYLALEQYRKGKA